MKKNKSEPINFKEEDLIFNDGSDDKEKLEKEAEKNDKETEKELEKREEVVDDINDADAPKPEPEAKDNAKGVKELKDAKPKEPTKDKGKDMHHKFKLLPEGMKLTLDESELVEEPIPGDLMKSYKKSRYKGADGADLHNAQYIEMTPEEAIKKAKEEGTWGNLRILIDGKLVKLRDIGSGAGETDYKFRNRHVNNPFVDKNGKKKYDTGSMSSRQVLDVAAANGNKIYWTNEAQPEGQKDPEMMAARANNVFSPRSNVNDLPDRNANGDYYERGSSTTPSNLGAYYRASRDGLRNLKSYQDEILDLRQRYKDGKISKDEMDSEINHIKQGYWYRSYSSDMNNYKDRAARARYYDSEVALQKKFRSFKDLKDQLRDKDYEVKNAQDKIDDLKANGSPQTNRNKRYLAQAEKELQDTMKEIAKLKMRLRYADENDKEALDKANQAYNDVIAKYANAQTELDKLMGRATESYQPWGDAVETYNKITEANLVEDFEDLVDTLYPQGLTESRLNDLLSYKSSMILEMLDLEEEREKINS